MPLDNFLIDMATTREQVQGVVNRLHEKLVQYAQSAELQRRCMPIPHPPASSSEIARFEQYIGESLPNSYRLFLEIYNGYEWLAFSGPMLPIQAIMPGGTFYDDIKQWKLDTAENGLGEVLDGIVIANLGSVNNWVYLDPNKPGADNELTVVLWDPEYTTEYKDLVEFFEGRIAVCEQALGET
jgi:hypothetical protein